MKATIEIEFDGCFHGCPFVTDASFGPNYCTKTNPHRMIIGYSSSSSQIPAGKRHPYWCPEAEVGE